MKSKIINMAEKIKDAEDRLLESMFESAPLSDDGFSARVLKRLNRRLWIRRLTLPVAVVTGGVIAFKPLAGLFVVLSNLGALIPSEFTSGLAVQIPQLQNIVMGAVLLAVAMFTVRMLDEI